MTNGGRHEELRPLLLPVPFRGQFIRGILAHCGYSWDEYDVDAIEGIMDCGVEKQPVAFMGPPVLIDRERNFAISQMPAIAIYLGERLDMLPTTVEGRALSAKIVNDANDVLDELTLDGGREMWTPEKWEEFIPRFPNWVCTFADTGEPAEQASQRGQMTDRSGPEGMGRKHLRLSQAARPPSRSRGDVLPEPGCASDPSCRDQAADWLQMPPRHLWQQACRCYRQHPRPAI